jgi:uncharacterized protein with PhoU and TrkA domain
LATYAATFNPDRIAANIAKLEQDHDTLTQQCLKLKTLLSIQKVNK